MITDLEALNWVGWYSDGANWNPSSRCWTVHKDGGSASHIRLGEAVEQLCLELARGTQGTTERMQAFVKQARLFPKVCAVYRHLYQNTWHLEVVVDGDTYGDIADIQESLIRLEYNQRHDKRYADDVLDIQTSCIARCGRPLAECVHPTWKVLYVREASDDSGRSAPAG